MTYEAIQIGKFEFAMLIFGSGETYQLVKLVGVGRR
jgi:hypothetical protein